MTVPHHVSGVLRVGQDVTHVRPGPSADRPLRVDWRGWRVAGQVSVEPVGDSLVAQPLTESPREDPPDDGRLSRVGFEEGLLLALRPSGRDGVGDLAGSVAVAGLTDVEPCSVWTAKPSQAFSSILVT